jgi:hypothetical protein
MQLWAVCVRRVRGVVLRVQLTQPLDVRAVHGRDELVGRVRHLSAHRSSELRLGRAGASPIRASVRG